MQCKVLNELIEDYEDESDPTKFYKLGMEFAGVDLISPSIKNATLEIVNLDKEDNDHEKGNNSSIKTIQ